MTARSEWVHAASAVRKAEAMGDALQLIEALSLERGVLQERALSDGSVTANPAVMAAANHALLDRAQRSMRRAELPDDAVTQSRDMLVKLRRQVAEAVIRPVTERDPGVRNISWQSSTSASRGPGRRGAGRARGGVR